VFVYIENTETKRVHCIVNLLESAIHPLDGEKTSTFIQGTARMCNEKTESQYPFLIECALFKCILEYETENNPLSCCVQRCSSSSQYRVSSNTASFMHYMFAFQRTFPFDVIHYGIRAAYFSPHYEQRALCETHHWEELKSHNANLDPHKRVQIDTSCESYLNNNKSQSHDRSATSQIMGLMVRDAAPDQQSIPHALRSMNVFTQMLVYAGLNKADEAEDTMPE